MLPTWLWWRMNLCTNMGVMRAGEQSLTPSLHKDATGISSQLKIYTEDACKMFYSHSKLNDCMRCAVGSLLTPLPAAGSLCDWTHVRSLDSSVVMSLLLLLPDHVGLCQRDYLLGWSLVTVKSGLCHCGCIPCWPSRAGTRAMRTTHAKAPCLQLKEQTRFGRKSLL